MADEEDLVLEVMGCILQVLHTRKVWKRRSGIPVRVEDIWIWMVDVDDETFNEALRRLIDEDEYPVEYADRKKTSIWITRRDIAKQKLKEIRYDIHS